MVRLNKNKGEIRIPAGINVWKHELITANALAGVGYVVEFLPTKDVKAAKSPDILMDGEKRELKAPKTDKLSAIERNLKRATKQSDNIVIDSHRLRKIHDSTAQKFLCKNSSNRKLSRSYYSSTVSIKLLI